MSSDEDSDVIKDDPVNMTRMVIETGIDWAIEFDNYCHSKDLLIGEKMMLDDAINFMKFLFMKKS
jgi:hypothetical protein